MLYIRTCILFIFLYILAFCGEAKAQNPVPGFEIKIQSVMVQERIVINPNPQVIMVEQPVINDQNYYYWFNYRINLPTYNQCVYPVQVVRPIYYPQYYYRPIPPPIHYIPPTIHYSHPVKHR